MLDAPGHQGCGIRGFSPTTSVIQGHSPLYMGGGGLWEALFVVSQKWSFPTAMLGILDHSDNPCPIAG